MQKNLFEIINYHSQESNPNSLTAVLKVHELQKSPQLLYLESGLTTRDHFQSLFRSDDLLVYQ